MFSSFLIYLLCKFSVYDFKGYYLKWNADEKSTDIKRYWSLVWRDIWSLRDLTIPFLSLMNKELLPKSGGGMLVKNLTNLSLHISHIDTISLKGMLALWNFVKTMEYGCKTVVKLRMEFDMLILEFCQWGF